MDEADDGLQPRPISRLGSGRWFETEPPAPKDLTWIASEPVVVISIFERAGYWVQTTIKYTKGTVFLIRLLTEVISSYQQFKESNMSILKITFRVIKWVGVACGAGGFATGLMSPETAALLAGGSYVLGDVVYTIGDYLDDKKLNKSWDPTAVDSNKP